MSPICLFVNMFGPLCCQYVPVPGLILRLCGRFPCGSNLLWRGRGAASLRQWDPPKLYQLPFFSLFCLHPFKRQQSRSLFCANSDSPNLCHQILPNTVLRQLGLFPKYFILHIIFLSRTFEPQWHTWGRRKEMGDTALKVYLYLIKY